MNPLRLRPPRVNNGRGRRILQDLRRRPAETHETFGSLCRSPILPASTDRSNELMADPSAGSSTKSPLLLRLGHSPDPDDAFMFYALAMDLLPTGRYRFEHVLQDIQTLNQRAMKGELEITAISIHAYPYVADKYALTSCGSSMGDKYGPMVIAKKPMKLEELRGKRIAIPGKLTTAFLAL